MVKRPDGFTLIELLVTLTIIGLVISVAYSMQHYGIVSFSRGESLASQQQNVRNISRTLSDEIRFSRKVEILDEVPESQSANETCFWSTGQNVMKKRDTTEEVFVAGSNDTFYSLEFEAVGADPQMIDVIVRVNSSHGLYELETSVLGLNLKSGDVKGLDSGSVIRISN